eukprot:scaffold8748_cov118-Skeletonema_dohrnii-CCMP3373.AAC.2
MFANPAYIGLLKTGGDTIVRCAAVQSSRGSEEHAGYSSKHKRHPHPIPKSTSLHLLRQMSSNNNTKIITVPTKQHDGGGNSDMTNLAVAAPQPKLDAFTKYSSNLIRMKELLLLGDDNEQDEEEDDLDYLSSLNKALRYASISDRGQQIDRNNHGHDDASASKRRKGNN